MNDNNSAPPQYNGWEQSHVDGPAPNHYNGRGRGQARGDDFAPSQYNTGRGRGRGRGGYYKHPNEDDDSAPRHFNFPRGRGYGRGGHYGHAHDADDSAPHHFNFPRGRGYGRGGHYGHAHDADDSAPRHFNFPRGRGYGRGGHYGHAHDDDVSPHHFYSSRGRGPEYHCGHIGVNDPEVMQRDGHGSPNHGCGNHHQHRRDGNKGKFQHPKSVVPDKNNTPMPTVVRGADGRLYRRSAQVFFVNEMGEFLCLTPCGKPNKDYLQTVQGGVEKDELPEDAVRREIMEEIGLQCGDDDLQPRIIRPVILPNAVHIDAKDEERNSEGEIIDETRASFRYKSKTWRKMGINGQELYPFLAYLSSKAISNVRFDSCQQNPEFVAAKWAPLGKMVEQSCPSKKEVMKNILYALYHTTKEFFNQQRLSSDVLDEIVNKPYFKEAESRV